MARVSVAEVKQLINTSESDADVIAAIAAANSIVTDQLTGKGLSNKRLKEIERWLSAHFMGLIDRAEGQVERERIGDTEVAYFKSSSDNARGFGMTRFGQAAMTLDTTGTLASMGRTRARLRIVDAPTSAFN